MNDIERVLRADVERLIDRLSTSVPEGSVAAALGARVDAAVWALAVWRSAFADESAETAVPRAA